MNNCNHSRQPRTQVICHVRLSSNFACTNSTKNQRAKVNLTKTEKPQAEYLQRKSRLEGIGTWKEELRTKYIVHLPYEENIYFQNTSNKAKEYTRKRSYILPKPEVLGLQLVQHHLNEVWSEEGEEVVC